MIYYGNVLDWNEARIYNDIVAGISSWQNEIELGECDMDSAMRLYSIAVIDNPEIFWVLPEIEARSLNGKVTIEPAYGVDPRDVSRRWAAIDAHVRQYRSMLSAGAGDWEKVEKAYEYIIMLCEYGNSPDDQNMCSVIVDEISCCAGYSKAFSYLLSTVGVCAPVIRGQVASSRRQSGGHAWNAVCVDGRWSWCDVTWGDPVYLSGGKRESDVLYDFLCVPDSELSSTHYPDSTCASLLPRCNCQGGDWYSHHGLYFKKFDEDAVATALQADVLSREIGFGRDMNGDAYLKLGRKKAFKEAKRVLCDQMGIKKILEPVYAAYGYAISNFSYSFNDEMLAMHVRYTIAKIP